MGDALRAVGIAAEYTDAVGPHPAAPYADATEPGPVEGSDGRRALVVLAPLGRLSVAQWRLLTGIAADDGSGALRLTPWRGIVVPGLSAAAADRRLRDLATAGLITDPASPGGGSPPARACPAAPSPARTCAAMRRPRSPGRIRPGRRLRAGRRLRHARRAARPLVGLRAALRASARRLGRCAGVARRLSDHRRPPQVPCPAAGFT
ncbi:hypothetical protein O1L44_17280 [Streptomyces noursei]|nr:hypothetical protein [Streptomyces noursei]